MPRRYRIYGAQYSAPSMVTCTVPAGQCGHGDPDCGRHVPLTHQPQVAALSAASWHKVSAGLGALVHASP
jgi:hypothetical protein